MSDFWLKKMRTYFQRIDFDKDGAITRKDFEGMAERVIETGKLQGDQQEDLRRTLTAVSQLPTLSLPPNTPLHILHKKVNKIQII